MPIANRSSHHGSHILSWPIRASLNPALSTNAFQSADTPTSTDHAGELGAEPTADVAPRDPAHQQGPQGTNA